MHTYKHLFILILLVNNLFFISCITQSQEKEIQEQEVAEEQEEKLPFGIWRAELTSETGIIIPFNFELSVSKNNEQYIYLLNGEEKILIDDISYADGVFTFPMHAFDSKIIAKYDSQNEKLKGEWIKYGYGKEIKMVFEAKYKQDYRFKATNQKNDLGNIDGKWEVNFEDENINALGIFEQKGDKITGTFLTVTGDYRFLEGQMNGNEMNLSCFDGAHAFLFKAKIQADGSLLGDFWSGKTYHVPWTAKRNQKYKLPNPNSLTFLKEGYEKVKFAFPNLNGDTVRWDDEKLKGKVVILQLFGTWCPNCLDESRFYAPFYDRNKSKGLEIIGLAYESTEDFQVAKKRVERMKERVNADYEFLIAGVSQKIDAAKTLPMLNHVMSFPTSIFIDKWGNVRRIHTGFTGPGTGIYYDNFIEDFTLFVEKLLNEEAEP